MSALRWPLEWFRSLALAWQVAVPMSVFVFAGAGAMGGGGPGPAVDAPPAHVPAPAIVVEETTALDVPPPALDGGAESGAVWHYTDRAGTEYDVTCDVDVDCTNGVPYPVALIEVYAKNGMCLAIDNELDHWRLHATAGAPFRAFAQDTLNAIAC